MKYRVLYLADLPADTLRQWFSEADAETQARLLGFRSAQAQKQSLAADHLAREMLGEAVLLRRDGGGKPYAEGSDLCFNLSHSGEFAACAVHEGPVGIDLEALREVSPRTARRVCSAADLAFVYADGAFDSGRFLQIWTAKEAYLKYLGCGLRGKNLREVETVAEGRLELPGLQLFTEQTDRYVLSVVYK